MRSYSRKVGSTSQESEISRSGCRASAMSLVRRSCFGLRKENSRQTAMHSAPAETRRSRASHTVSSSRGSTTSPCAPTRSRTPRRIDRGARNTGVCGSRRTSYISRRICRPISRVSRNPFVVTMPRRPPFFSRTALVATVVPWATWVMAAGSTPTDSTTRLSAAMAASPGSAGVLAILNTIAGCPSRTQTTSVKVPPMSIPIRHGAQESLMAYSVSTRAAKVPCGA